MFLRNDVRFIVAVQSSIYYLVLFKHLFHVETSKVRLLEGRPISDFVCLCMNIVSLNSNFMAFKCMQ